MNEVTALYADDDGNILDIPGLGAMGRVGNAEVPLRPKDLIPLPRGSDLMFMPGRQAVGVSSDGEVLPVAGLAVAAVIPPGYTRTHVPAYRIDSENNDSARPLPLYGYTAVAVYNDELYVAAIHTDNQDDKWNPEHYNTKNLSKLVKNVKKDLSENRLVDHLSNCALTWHCQTAENLFIIDGRRESRFLLFVMQNVWAVYHCSQQSVALLPRAGLNSNLRQRKLPK